MDAGGEKPAGQPGHVPGDWQFGSGQLRRRMAGPPFWLSQYYRGDVLWLLASDDPAPTVWPVTTSRCSGGSR